jgi:penicillin-binding protein 2
MTKSYRFLVTVLWLANLVVIRGHAATTPEKVDAPAKPTTSLSARKPKPTITAKKPTGKVIAKSKTTVATKKVAAPKRRIVARRRITRRRAPAPAPKFATYGDPAQDDDASREDPIVRAAAVKALGNMIGSVVVVNPENGQILSIVNQKLALASGYQPCSSFKPAVALAALSEGIINNDSNRIKLGKRWFLDLEHALAKSNNLYFESLGRSLGLERLQYYARLFGLGEAATIGVGEESNGQVPDQAPPLSAGGVGKVASFGQGIAITTLQLASFTSAMANGGKLYYLQYPVAGEPFVPRLKRELPISDSLNPVRMGMESAVLAGTARRANTPDIQILGKTGTCSEDSARLGWFAGYSKAPAKLAIVVLLRTGVKLGGGPKASEVAGRFFRELSSQNYFAQLLEPTFSAQILPAAAALGTLR